jgi:hypothetical protein
MKDINWLVFQKYDRATPVEFAELLWLDDTLTYRIGKLQTFGISKKTPFMDAEPLAKAVASKRASLESEGFTLVREWHFDRSRFDFALLQRELEVAIKSAVKQLRDDHADLNAFALMTDADAMTIALIAHEFESIEGADDYILFVPDEWEIWEGNVHFDIAYRLILSQHRDDLTTVDHDEYKSGFTEAADAALTILDSQGLFGDREDRLLLYYVSDSDQDDDAIKRLNSAELFARWKAGC